MQIKHPKSKISHVFAQYFLFAKINTKGNNNEFCIALFVEFSISKVLFRISHLVESTSLLLSKTFVQKTYYVRSIDLLFKVTQ